MIKVLLIHADTLLRLSIRQILENIGDIQVVGDTSKGHEGIQWVQELQPDVVVLALKLPDIAGKTIVTRLLNLPQAPTLLVISFNVQQVTLSPTLGLGALGYLSSQASPAELINAIKKVNSGEAVIGEDIVHHLKAAGTNPSKLPESNLLTNREMEILVLVANGKPITEIADQLSLSYKTIHSYHDRILQKLNATNDVQLTWFAIREGWVTMDSILH